MDVSDRIAVMFDGKIVAIVKPEDTNEQELGLLMAGSQVKAGEQSQ